jgi:hypothetical protein
LKLFNFFLFVIPGNPRRRTKNLYRHALAKLYGLRIKRKPGESPLEFAERLDAESESVLHPFVALTGGYLKAVFAEDFTGEDFASVIRNYRELVRAFGKKYPLVLRVSGFLNPIVALGRL